MTPAVNTSIRDELKKELMARGFTANLKSPHGGIVLSDSYSSAADLVELLVTKVARREKLFRPSGVVPPDIAKGAVLSRLTLP
jgi:hypothetical protein